MTQAESEPGSPRRVRSRRTVKRFFVDNTIIDNHGQALGAYGIAVYATLCRFANRETQDCFPSHAAVAKKLGISERQVQRVMNVLREEGLVWWEGRVGSDGGQTSNLYVLLDPPGTDSPAPTDPQSDEQSECNNPKKDFAAPAALPKPKLEPKEQEISPLAISTPADLAFIGPMNKDRQAKRRRAITRYQSIQQRDVVRSAAEILGLAKLAEVVEYGMRAGISSVGQLAAYSHGAAKKTEAKSGETRTVGGEEYNVIRID